MEIIAILALVSLISLLVLIEFFFLYRYMVQKKIISSVSQFIKRMFKRSANSDNKKALLDEMENTLTNFSKGNIGAIFVVQRSDSLIDFIDSGFKIDCEFTYEISTSLLTCKDSPMHDGAIIVHDNRIKACSCYVPITNKSVKIGYGARHRAAIGLTELYDCVCFVVSETSGNISIAKDGDIVTYNKIPSDLRTHIRKAIYGSNE